MHSALHALFGRRRSILPARDIFDAELDRARTKPGCTLCCLVLDFDQHEMHSLLWEYCTDPYVGSQISQSWGYCSYHTWALAMVEHERLGDGLGVCVLYQPLLKQVLRLVSMEPTPGKPGRPLILPTHPQLGSTRCRFCQLAQREEAQFLARLIQRMECSLNNSPAQSWESLKTVLCLPHIRKVLAAGRAGSAETVPRQSLLRLKRRLSRKGEEYHVQQPMRTSFFHQHTEQYAAQVREEADSKQDSWRTIAQQVALLAGDLSALPMFAHMPHPPFHHHQRALREGYVANFTPVVLTGKRSQLRSPAGSVCPVCTSIAQASLARYLHIFETEHVTLESRDFCSIHHWMLAGGMATLANPEQMANYRLWLQKQLKYALHDDRTKEAQHEETSISVRPCLACAQVIVDSERTRDGILREIRASQEEFVLGDALLCLSHWQSLHLHYADAPDALAIEAQLLRHQRARLSQLDEAVEAYIASFNAAKRARGDIPDVPGAAWAWERLLAFFAGEPGVILPSSVSIQLE